MRTLFFIVLMDFLFVTPLFAQGDDYLLAAEKSLQAADAFITAEPDFNKNFFVESLLVLEVLSDSLQVLEKNPSTKASALGKELRKKISELFLHVLKTGLFEVSEEEMKALNRLVENPSTEFVVAYRSKLEACQLQATRSVEDVSELVTKFKEAELWCRPELFVNAKELLQILYRARLVNPERGDVLVAYMPQVARIVALRTWLSARAPLYLYVDEQIIREKKTNPQTIFKSSVSVVRDAKECFETFNASCGGALRFLATEFSEKNAPAALAEAKTSLTALYEASWVMPGEIRDARILSLMHKVMEKILILYKLNPELYLSAILEPNNPRAVFFDYIQILEEIASGKREPDWTKPTLALDELEKAYRWYGQHREMQSYVSEVMVEVQKLVHETGSTELKGKLLREVVTVIHGFHEEMALK